MPLKTRISQMNMNGKHQKAVSMKKIYLLGAMALMAFTACQNIETEVPSEKENGKVPMTFVASLDMDESDSKVAVDEVDTANKKLKFAWKAGDEIAIYDNLSSTPNLFTATADGTTVAFSGSVTDGATKFVAIYPYSAAESADAETGACVASFPREQTAVAGSFDPEALVATAYAEATDVDLRFRLLGALLSFKVDFDDVVYVEFSGSRPMTGQLSFNSTASGPSSVSTGTPNYKDVSIKNADGSPLTKGETYYVCVRHTGSNSQEGFTAKLITADAKVASRTGSNPLQIARKTLYPLGLFSSSNVTLAYDRCAVYNAGFDVTIAGKTYNKATDGEATLLSDGGVFKTGMSGLIFLEASANVTNTSEATITSDVVITSNDPDHPATYKGTNGKSILVKSGSLVLDNLIIDMSAMTSGQFLAKKDSDGDFTSLTVEKCDIRNVARPFYAPNSSYLTNGINSIRMNGNRIATTANVQLFSIGSGATTLAGYKDFTFTNNVLYAPAAQNGTYVFYTTASGIVESTCNQEVIMDNNLFYNMPNANGLFRTHYLKSIYIRNNILWAEDGSYGSNAKMFKANLAVASAAAEFAGASSDNYCYGNLGTKKWTISDSACRGPLTEVTTLDSTPIESFNTSTGEFTLVSAYADYGPQL